MKKVLITGASGFIGSFLVQEALNQGYEVYAGVRPSSSKHYLADSRIIFLELLFSRIELIKEKLIYYEKKIGRFEYIIHNAGITKSNAKKDFNTVNFKYTVNFIQALIETNCVPDKFIYMSSLAAYGPGNEITMQPIIENDIPSPISMYGTSKLRAELFINSLKKFPYLIFRPTGVYGPREKDYFLMYKAINNHLETYIGSSKQQLSFIYVKDLVELIFKALQSEIVCKSYFVTDGNNYTSVEFSKMVKTLLNKKTIKLVFPKFMVRTIAFCLEKIFVLFNAVPTLNTEKYKEISCSNWLCDSSKTMKDFNFTPKYDLQKGLTETISWYKAEKLL